MEIIAIKLSSFFLMLMTSFGLMGSLGGDTYAVVNVKNLSNQEKMHKIIVALDDNSNRAKASFAKSKKFNLDILEKVDKITFFNSQQNKVKGVNITGSFDINDVIKLIKDDVPILNNYQLAEENDNQWRILSIKDNYQYNMILALKNPGEIWISNSKENLKTFLHKYNGLQNKQNKQEIYEHQSNFRAIMSFPASSAINYTTKANLFVVTFIDKIIGSVLKEYFNDNSKKIKELNNLKAVSLSISSHNSNLNTEFNLLFNDKDSSSSFHKTLQNILAKKQVIINDIQKENKLGYKKLLSLMAIQLVSSAQITLNNNIINIKLTATNKEISNKFKKETGFELDLLSLFVILFKS